MDYEEFKKIDVNIRKVIKERLSEEYKIYSRELSELVRIKGLLHADTQLVRGKVQAYLEIMGALMSDDMYPDDEADEIEEFG